MSDGMKAGYSSRGGAVNSPYEKNEHPSGSKPGSAVAVTANLCVASFGTDTAGSIISPALKNGIVGFRPSVGTLCQQGILPVSFTLDTAGPMTRTVTDAIVLMSELSDTAIDWKDLKQESIVVGVNQADAEGFTVEEKNLTDTLIGLMTKEGVKVKPAALPVVSKMM